MSRTRIPWIGALAVRGWRRWLALGCVVVLVAGVALVVVGVRSGWLGRCVEPEQSAGSLGGWEVPPDGLEDAMVVQPPFRYEGTDDFPFESVATVVETERTPFDAPRQAVTLAQMSPFNLWVAGSRADQVLLWWRGDFVDSVDGGTGGSSWERRMPGPGSRHAAAPSGDRLVMVYDAPAWGEREQVTVATVDVADGSVQSCTRVGPLVDAPPEPRAANPQYPSWWYEQRQEEVSAAVTDAGEVALVRQDDADAFRLTVVDPQAGEVQFDTTIDLSVLPADLRGTGEVVVTSVAPDRTSGILSPPPYLRRSSGLAYDQLSLRAFSATDGALAWAYAAEPSEPDGEPYTHRIIGTTDDRAVVFAARWVDSLLNNDVPDPGRVSGQVVVLDAATGEPVWQQAGIGPHGLTDARPYGDLVLVQEPDPADPQRRWLASYELATGEQRWRVPDPVAAGRLDAGVHLEGDGMVLLPAPDGQGVVAVELVDGAARHYFEGTSARWVRAGEDTIGVAFALVEPQVVDTPDAVVVYGRRAPGTG